MDIGPGAVLAALLSKTVTCTLPAAALLVAWGVRGRLTWRDMKITAPFFVLGISMGILTAYLEVTHVGLHLSMCH